METFFYFYQNIDSFSIMRFVLDTIDISEIHQLLIYIKFPVIVLETLTYLLPDV